MLETLRRPDLERLIGDYFDMAGYRLVVRESEGWAGILPDVERIAAPRMRIDETLVLLLLRRMWEESAQADDLGRYGSVLVSLNEAYDAYQDMVARARRPALSVSDFRTQIESLARRAVVRLGEQDDEIEDIELTVRAHVAIVAGDDFTGALEQLLARPEYRESASEADGGDREAAGQ